MADSRPDDDAEIDFSKITSFFKKKPQKKTEPSREPGHHADSSHEKSGEDARKRHDAPRTQHARQEDEEASIDLGFLKNMFKGDAQKRSAGKSDDDIGFDAGAIGSFVRGRPWILTLVLLMLVVWMTVDVRMTTSTLPFTSQFAQNSVDQYFRGQIEAQVMQQSPNLPAEMRAQVVEQQYQQFIAANRDYLNSQIAGTSLLYKTAWTNEPAGDCRNDFDWLRCQPYMPDIDPYYWYRYARNIDQKGHIGDEVRDGVQWDNHMLAPTGRPITNPDQFHPYMLAYLHKVMGAFVPGITLYQSTFFYPVIVSALSAIFVFLIARRIAGDVGGLFAGAMFAYNFAALNRTLFGHADTDAWVLFFPILITWLFLESFHASRTRWLLLYTGLAGLAVGIYSIAWGGWWYIFDFIIAMSGLYLLYHVVIHLRALLKDPRAALRIEAVRNAILIPLSFVISSGVFVSLLNGVEVFLYVPLNALGFTQLKNAVLETLWPNVLTTVAELNEGNLGSVINAVGGPLLFYVALLGIGLTMLTIGKNNRQYLAKDDTFFVVFIVVYYGALVLARGSIGDVAFIALLFAPVLIRAVIAIFSGKRIDIGVAILLSIWFAGTTYATFKGIRFTLLLAPAFAVAFGVVFGVLFTLLWRWLDAMVQSRAIVKSAIMVVVFGLFFFMWFWPPGLLYLNGGSISGGAYNIAESDVPIVNDAWWGALKTIESSSQPNAIITSWWDFGHHFKAIADRPVTFDGTTQDTPQAHWVGKTFLTSSEREAKGILQMLACGGNGAFDTLVPLVGNDTVRAVGVLNELTVLDRDAATSVLTREGLTGAEAAQVLALTHCDPPELFIISSEDMIGKAGVWAHFGAWDFEKAYVWQFLRDEPLDFAVDEMVARFNYSEKQAEDRWYEAQSITSEAEANGWVSPWPGYLGSGSCSLQVDIACGVNLQGQPLVLLVNTTSRTASIGVQGQTPLIPTSIVYVDNETVRTIRFPNPTFSFSFALIPSGDGWNYVLGSPELIEGMFTRTFYLQGHGLRYFRPLTHQTSISGTDIYVYKVDWDGGEREIVEGFFPTPVRDATIDYIGYLPDGTVFDSSIVDWRSKNVTANTTLADRNDTSPITFALNSGTLIKGVDLAVSQMKAGEEKTVEVPPELGYGAEPSADNPLAGRTIKFTIFVHEIDQ